MMFKKEIFTVLLMLLVCSLWAQGDWVVNSSDYENSMTITGVFSLEDSIYDQTSGLVVGAFNSEGTCVGRAEALYYSKVESYCVPLMVYSDLVIDTFSLKVYLPNEDSVYQIYKSYPFELDGRIGNYSAPEIWRTVAEPLSISETQAVQASVFPNPASTIVTVDGVGIIAVSVYGLNGCEMQVPLSDDGGKWQLDVSALSPGMYMLGIDDGKIKSLERLIVE